MLSAVVLEGKSCGSKGGEMGLRSLASGVAVLCLAALPPEMLNSFPLLLRGPSRSYNPVRQSEWLFLLKLCEFVSGQNLGQAHGACSFSRGSPPLQFSSMTGENDAKAIPFHSHLVCEAGREDVDQRRRNRNKCHGQDRGAPSGVSCGAPAKRHSRI